MRKQKMIEALIILYTSLLLLLTITKIKGKHRFTTKYFYETSQLNWLASKCFCVILYIIIFPVTILKLVHKIIQRIITTNEH